MPNQPVPATEIIPYVFCADVPVSMDWLARVFGLTEQLRHATPRGTHGEMQLDGCRIMLGFPSNAMALRTPAALGSATQGVFVYVPDVIAHHAHTLADGGAIEGPPTDHGYGLTYTAYDLDGHPWYLHSGRRDLALLLGRLWATVRQCAQRARLSDLQCRSRGAAHQPA